jgi:hypothetical protein
MAKQQQKHIKQKLTMKQQQKQKNYINNTFKQIMIKLQNQYEIRV